MDSFEGFGTDPASLHKYTFNHNDPINRRDPSGHFSLTENQVVMALAPMVRGAVQALQQSLTGCYARTVLMGGITGGALGGAVSGAITGLIQAFTGEFDARELLKAIGEGTLQGAAEGALLAANPFAFSAYQGYQAFQAGHDFWKVINDPNAPTYVKYLQAVAFVTTALPVISPKLAQRMNDLLIKKFCFPAGTEVTVETGSKPIEKSKSATNCKACATSLKNDTGAGGLSKPRRWFPRSGCSLREKRTSSSRPCHLGRCVLSCYSSERFNARATP